MIFNINKKGMTMGFLISIIITTIGLGAILNFSYSTTKNSLSATDIQLCKLKMWAKSTKVVKTVETIDGVKESVFGESPEYDLNLIDKINVCSSSQVELQSTNKDEIFPKIAKEMDKCQKMYGDKKYDFESNWGRTGEYCYVCSRLNFDTDKTKEFKYSEFVDYVEKETDYDIDLNSVVIDDKDLNKLNALVQKLGKDEDTIEFAKVLALQNNAFLDQYNKKISFKDKNGYIVYKFNRLEEEMKDKLIFASVSVGTGIAAIPLAESAVKAALMAGTLSVACGPFYLICATVGTVVGGVGMTTYKIGKTVVKGVEFKSTYSKAKKLILKIFEKSKIGKIKKKFSAVIKKYELDTLTPREVENKLKSIVGPEGHKKTPKDLEELYTKLEELEKLSKNKGEKFKFSEFIFKTENIKYLLALVGTGAFGSIGYSLNFGNLQYVEYMSQEEYYRNCGFDPLLKK